MSSARTNTARRRVHSAAMMPGPHAHAIQAAAARPSQRRTSQRRSSSAVVTLLPRPAASEMDILAPVGASVEDASAMPVAVQTRPCILIVEEDPYTARAFREMLANEGELDWNIQVAEGSERALALAAAQPPHVVLLDVDLPDFDGVEVYHRLRADPRTHATRVLFLTAATSLDLYQRGINAGVVLRKPFEVRELASLVRMLIAS